MKDKKVAVVSGASSGIGRSLVQALSNSGYYVVLLGRSAERLAKAQKTLNSRTSSQYYAVDIRSVVDLQQFGKWLKDEFGCVDALINCAGVGRFGELAEDDFDTVMDTNFKGSYFLSKVVVPLIKQGGHLLFFSSFLTQVNFAGTAILSASKAAIETLTKVYAKELKERNIAVNAIRPGIVNTDFMKNAKLTFESRVELKRNIFRLSNNRPVRGVDITQLVLFLMTADVNSITGEILSVDNGIKNG